LYTPRVSKCTGAKYIGLTEIMHPATIYGVGVITQMYFVIFAAFKESRTLNLAQRSFMVIHFGGNRKPAYDFIYRPLIVTFALSSTVSEILPVLYAQSQLPK